MRSHKNWMVGLLVATSLFFGLSAVASPASAAGYGGPSSTPFNMTISFDTEHGRLTQVVSVYDQATDSWVAAPTKEYGHVVRRGNHFWLQLKKGESVSKGNSYLYYGHFTHGRVNNTLDLSWNGKPTTFSLSVKVGHNNPQKYRLIQGYIGIVIKGEPLPTAPMGKGGV